MRFVNSIRGSDDSEALTLMSDQTLIELLLNDTFTHVKHHSGTACNASFECGSAKPCMMGKQVQSTTLDSITLKFKPERHV